MNKKKNVFKVNIIEIFVVVLLAVAGFSLLIFAEKGRINEAASFKDSDYWKEACEKNSDNITRAGRFGIGFLATFLLGERITVITRHIKDSKGFIFSVTKDDEVINAERIDTVEIGTTISVDLSDNAIDFFNKAYNGRTIRWNEWYHFTDPQIEYYMNSAKLLPEINYQVPPEKTVDRKWFYVESDLFRDVKYGFFPVNSRTNSRNIHRSFWCKAFWYC